MNISLHSTLIPTIGREMSSDMNGDLMPFHLAVFALCSHLGYHHRLNIQKFCLFQSWGYLYPQLEGETEQNLFWVGQVWKQSMSTSPTTCGPALGIWPYLDAKKLGKKKSFLLAFSLHKKWLHFGNHALICPGSKELPRQTASLNLTL